MVDHKKLVVVILRRRLQRGSPRRLCAVSRQPGGWPDYAKQQWQWQGLGRARQGPSELYLNSASLHLRWPICCLETLTSLRLDQREIGALFGLAGTGGRERYRPCLRRTVTRALRWG